MTFDEWIDTYLDDEKDTLCLMDAWRAGAEGMSEHLADHGYFSESYKEQIEKELKIVQGV